MKIIFVGYAKSIHLKRWAEYFQNQGNEVKIVSPVEEKDLDVEIITWKELLKNNYFSYVFSRIPWIGFLFRVNVARNYLKKERPDILHIHNIRGTYFSQDFALTRYKPLIISVWGSDIVTLTETWSLRRLKTTWALKKASVITATSKFLYQVTKDLIGTNVKIEIIPFGIDLREFSLNKSKGVNSRIVKIGFFKHLEEKYGVEYLIRAFKIINEKHPNTELVIAGKGSLEAKLKNVINRLGISDKVKLLGFVERNKLPMVMGGMNITVMPSIFESESFGVAALESEALEIPVVASNIGGVSEVVQDGRTGILVEPKNVDALADALMKLIESKDLRVKMGVEGRKYVKEKYDWGENAESMKKLYDKLISNYQ